MEKLSENDLLFFKKNVVKHFSFLEENHNMNFIGIRESGCNDPRDHVLIASYISDEIKISIGWNKGANSLTIIIKFKMDSLSHRQSFVYFEAFIDFITHGKTSPVVPYIKPRMSARKINLVLRNREKVFSDGLEIVIKEISSRVREHFDDIKYTTSDIIKEYHEWYENESA